MSDLTDLFAKDPLAYTTDDLTAIIARLRDARKQFNLGNAKAGRVKPLTPAQQETLSLASQLNLDI